MSANDWAGALGGIGGSAGSIGGGFASSKLAWSRTKRMMKNRHQWEVADLRAAGLNPILSAMGTPSMGSSSAAQVPMNLGETMQKGALLASTLAMNKAAAVKATADANLADTKRGAIRPASEVGDLVGGAIATGGSALKKAFDFFTSGSAGGAAKPQYGSGARQTRQQRPGETKAEAFIRYRNWKRAMGANKMIEGDPSTY